MIVSCDNMYKCSNKRYEFDDVSYHWSLGIMYNYQIYDIADNNIWTYTLSSVYIGNMNIVPYLVIDDDKGAGYKVACEKAIKHEVAFFGVPFTTSQNKAIYSDIDSSDIFLPLFDEHITTTGEYKTGAQAKADGEVNAAWKDVFSDDSIINNYDPEYQPEPINPEPEQHDQGDLQNTTKNRYSNAGGLKQYVVTQDTVIKLTAFLNGTYLPTEADLTADFKGTNPQDYVVSVQKYPFDLPYESGDAPIYIGKIPSGLTGKILSRSGSSLAPLPINGVSTFDFGTLSLTKNNYNDFRDFQSKILLFLPFIGTIELDPRLYMYHSVNLIYTIDYNTGCVNAEIKRDGLTTETKGGTISITIPFFAANMGQYQNQLAQLDYAKQMTKIKGIQTALSTGFQIGSAALGMSNTGTTPSMGQLSAISQGGVSLAQNATQLSQIDYQIEHTAPSIGTLSTASAANAFFMDPRARLVIVRPMMLRNYDRAQYARTIGHACCKTATLSKFNGYTVAATAVLDNVHTKISNRQATEQEKQILRRALQNGIYI